MSIAENISSVRLRMDAAAQRVGRKPVDIALMAVTKTVDPERIIEAYNCGVHLLGENRVQEFAEKAPQLINLRVAHWHLIGHLQTNKATKAAELFMSVDSIDSLKIAQKLNASAAKVPRKLLVLIEINVAGEKAKSGVAPGSPELEALLAAAPSFAYLQINGLMCIPPFAEDPEDARPYFRQVRELRDMIAARNLPAVSMRELSMGMSHDFEVAIEEGSTCVRVGTAIFGERQKT